MINMFNGLTDVERKIIGEIYTSSEAMDNLVVLCDEFGGRLAGSEENRGAAEFLRDKFKEYGFEDPHLEPFSFPGCEVVSGKLEIISPIKKEFSCIVGPKSVTGEIEADVVFLGHGERLGEQLDEIKGKVILTTDRGPIRKSIMAGAVGVIWMRPFPMMGPTTGVTPTVLPTVGIRYEDGCMINRFIKRKGRARVRLKTECRHFERESWNVCGEIPGNGTSDEFIMFGGHYDGHEIAQAAFDCGAPSMAALEIGRVLNKFREHLDRDIRVVLFSAEEFGCWGSKDYAQKHAGEMDRMRFTYQFDSCAGGSKQVLTIDHWPELEPFFKKLRKDLNIDMPLKQQKGPGDSRVFFNRGIPTGCIRESRRWDYPGTRGSLSTVWHTCYDTVDKIDMRSLREVVTIGAVSGFRMANTDKWPNHRTCEEIANTPFGIAQKKDKQLNMELKTYLIKKSNKLGQETKDYLSTL